MTSYFSSSYVFIREVYFGMLGLLENLRRGLISNSIREYNLSFVGISEIKMQAYNSQFVDSISGDANFKWLFFPASGLLGGILLGMDVDAYDIFEEDIGIFMLGPWSGLKLLISSRLLCLLMVPGPRPSD